MTITFDKSAADLILTIFEAHQLECTGCGKLVTKDDLGAIAKIDGEFTIWHNLMPCLMAFSTATHKATEKVEL